jgi:hypothetical protein
LSEEGKVEKMVIVHGEQWKRLRNG